MEQAVKAIEATGIIDEGGHLLLDEPLPPASKGRVKVILLFPDKDDISENEWLRGAITSGTFDFLGDAAEEVYLPTDGKPYNVQG
mgnify:CR=1 FL=1